MSQQLTRSTLRSKLAQTLQVMNQTSHVQPLLGDALAQFGSEVTHTLSFLFVKDDNRRRHRWSKQDSQTIHRVLEGHKLQVVQWIEALLAWKKLADPAESGDGGDEPELEAARITELNLLIGAKFRRGAVNDDGDDDDDETEKPRDLDFDIISEDEDEEGYGSAYHDDDEDEEKSEKDSLLSNKGKGGTKGEPVHVQKTKSIFSYPLVVTDFKFDQAFFMTMIVALCNLHWLLSATLHNVFIETEDKEAARVQKEQEEEELKPMREWLAQEDARLESARSERLSNTALMISDALEKQNLFLDGIVLSQPASGEENSDGGSHDDDDDEGWEFQTNSRIVYHLYESNLAMALKNLKIVTELMDIQDERGMGDVSVAALRIDGEDAVTDYTKVDLVALGKAHKRAHRELSDAISQRRERESTITLLYRKAANYNNLKIRVESDVFYTMTSEAQALLYLSMARHADNMEAVKGITRAAGLEFDLWSTRGDHLRNILNVHRPPVKKEGERIDVQNDDDDDDDDDDEAVAAKDRWFAKDSFETRMFETLILSRVESPWIYDTEGNPTPESEEALKQIVWETVNDNDTVRLMLLMIYDQLPAIPEIFQVLRVKYDEAMEKRTHLHKHMSAYLPASLVLYMSHFVSEDFDFIAWLVFSSSATFAGDTTTSTRPNTLCHFYKDMELYQTWYEITSPETLRQLVMVETDRRGAPKFEFTRKQIQKFLAEQKANPKKRVRPVAKRSEGKKKVVYWMSVLMTALELQSRLSVYFNPIDSPSERFRHNLPAVYTHWDDHMWGPTRQYPGQWSHSWRQETLEEMLAGLDDDSPEDQREAKEIHQLLHDLETEKSDSLRNFQQAKMQYQTNKGQSLSSSSPLPPSGANRQQLDEGIQDKSELRNMNLMELDTTLKREEDKLKTYENKWKVLESRVRQQEEDLNVTQHKAFLSTQKKDKERGKAISEVIRLLKEDTDSTGRTPTMNKVITTLQAAKTQGIASVRRSQVREVETKAINEAFDLINLNRSHPRERQPSQRNSVNDDNTTKAIGMLNKMKSASTQERVAHEENLKLKTELLASSSSLEMYAKKAAKQRETVREVLTHFDSSR